MTKTELFIELAQPDKLGKSRWVKTSEFVGKYKDLKLGNGGSWWRGSSALAKKYVIEFNKSLSPGNSIDAIRLCGFNKKTTFNNGIKPEIRQFFKDEKCVMFGVRGNSENTKIEIDHKDGRKNSLSVSNFATQKVEDFQPLCKAANDIKRQICKKCKETNIRWDAKNIKGNPYSFYLGNEKYTEKLGCKGCYQYDPVAYRIECVKKISQEVCSDILKKLYSENQ